MIQWSEINNVNVFCQDVTHLKNLNKIFLKCTLLQKLIFTLVSHSHHNYTPIPLIQIFHSRFYNSSLKIVYLFRDGASFINEDSGGDVGSLTFCSGSLLSCGKCPVASLASY